MDPARARVERALAGNTEAVRALVDQLTPVIQARVVRALLRRAHQGKGRALRQEVEDLTQEVFLALFDDGGRALRAWNPDRGLSLESFAGLIAERQVASILRSGRRSPWTEDPTEAEQLDGPTGDDGALEARVEAKGLLSALVGRLRETLSPLGLFMFERLVVEEREVDAVCEETGMSRDAVYAWRSRLSSRARKLANELVSDPPATPRKPSKRPVAPAGGER